MTESVVVNTYRQRIAARMAGGAQLAAITHMAFGSGGHSATAALSPSQNQTALNRELLRKPLAAITQETLFSVTGRGALEEHELIGAAISEAALIDANGFVVGIDTFAPKVKENNERYEISITLRF